MHLEDSLDPGDRVRSLFATPQRGWLSVPWQGGSTEWETRDGGKSWHPVFDLPWLEMHFADTRHGLAFLAKREREEEAALTPDTGDTWQRCGVTYLYKSFATVSLLDARRGWAWVCAPAPAWKASWWDGATDGPLRYGLMRTEDGGCRWHGVPSSQHPSSRGGELFFLDDDHGWLAGGYKGTLYRTADGGRSWQTMPLPFAKTSIKSVYFQDRDAGWLITGRGQLLATRDAGRTWHEVPRVQLVSQLGELLESWRRWDTGRLYGMLARGGCFAEQQVRQGRP
jgi:photosystem II stability/assembly factor-like uncharacterized protein